MSINYDLPIAKVEVNNVEIPIVGGGGGEGANLTNLVVNLNGEYLPNLPYNGF